MKRTGDARREQRFPRLAWDGERAKTFLAILQYLQRIEKRRRVWGKTVHGPRGKRVPTRKKSQEISRVTRNIRESRFVYTSAAGYGLSQASQSIGTKTPRWQPRGK